MPLIFPLTHPMRFPTLIVECIYAILAFELGIIFLIKFKKQKAKIKTFQEFGFAMLFFGFSLIAISNLIGNFFLDNGLISPFFIWNDGNIRLLLMNIIYIISSFFVIIFIYFSEKYQDLMVKKYLFTFIFLIFSILLIILLIIELELASIINFIFWILFTSFISLYLYKLLKIQKGNLLDLAKFYTSFFILIVGSVLSTEIIVQFFNLLFIGSIFQLTGICLVFLFFFKIEPFAELDWKNKVQDIYIINHQSGIGLYHKSFNQGFKDAVDSQIVSGAISSVNVILKTITDKEHSEFSVIKKQDKILSVFTSELITGVIISNEELKLIKPYLQKLVNKIESVYFNILINWDSDVTIFEPVEAIIKNILPI